jgi:hypothetical protein
MSAAGLSLVGQDNICPLWIISGDRDIPCREQHVRFVPKADIGRHRARRPVEYSRHAPANTPPLKNASLPAEQTAKG